ncbi:MAG: HAD-IIIA family hydrolase [Planctomycetota bacterium]|nr:MAG: HAD-IIIA family hydrolase [Planctomycetota bacterium]REJ95450.1 MAG: HAD-IIIA family hydrolase [Planctomycetota bacterium]REK26554.1 MAG: HAD-IIIA family hydrolase [Planctomycetota bacterium]REK34041.1 MAG: HAD-IIIA family hydrolase [Planctomycetota bacterium]
MPDDARQRWIVFDAVGTLIFADPPVHLAYHRIGRAHGSRLSPAEVQARFQAAFAHRVARSADNGPLTTSEAEERRFWQSLVGEVLPDAVDRDACFDELFRHFASPGSWQCFADVEETAAILREQDCRLAIASNFDGRLRGVCAALEELAAFEEVVVSSEVGYAKPAPQFFEAVLARCHCAPEQVVFVGDDAVNDVHGAQQAGLEAVHLDRTGKAGERSLRTLTELPALLNSG